MPEEIENEEVVETPAVETPNAVIEEKPDGESFNKDYVQGLRNESGKYRTERNEARTEIEALKAQLKEFEDAKLTDEEKRARDLEEAKSKAGDFESRLKEAELTAQLALAAKDEKIADVKAAVKLADRELIQYDANGRIQNISDVLDAMRSEYPSLFSAPQSAPNTGTTNPAKQPAAKKYTRNDLQGMSPERIVELMASGDLRDVQR